MISPTTSTVWEWAPALAVVAAVLVLWSAVLPRLSAATQATDQPAEGIPLDVAVAPVSDPGTLLAHVRLASDRAGVSLERWRPTATQEGVDDRYEAVVHGSFPDVGRFVDDVEAQAAVEAVDVRALDDATAVVEATVSLVGQPRLP